MDKIHMWPIGLAIQVMGFLPGGAPAADSAVQSDWSGGPGVPGPASAWGADFAACAGTAWLSIPGQLALASSPLALAPEHLINDQYYRSFGICAADVDRDGDTDVLGCAEQSGVVALWLSDGANPPGWTQQVIDSQFPGADAIQAADFDGDGALDIVANSSPPGGALAWWRNEGGTPITWTRQTVDPNAPGFEIHAADMDLDGDCDILGALYFTDEIAWWRNDGGSPVAWMRQTIATAFGGAHSAFAADLDADGDQDVVGAGATANEIAVWLNDGGTPMTWTKVVLRTGYLGARSVYVADLDADGDPDIAGTAWEHHVSWWRNEGGNPLVWTEQEIDAMFFGGHSIWAADVDGNGHLDVLAAGCTGNDIHWYANDGGTPITWTRNRVDANYPAPIEIRTGDLDGDGDLDVLATSYTLGEFTWWEATGFVAQGELESSILDTGTRPAQPGIEWSATLQPGTSLGFQVRHGEDPGALGDWSTEISAPGTLGLTLGRYVQYRALLRTTDPRYSPILKEVVIRWAELASTPDPSWLDGTGLGLRAIAPCRGEAVVQFVTARKCTAELAVLDSAGRMVLRQPPREFGEGQHRISLGRLGPGVYQCRMTGDGGSIARKLVILQ